ncbi:hypothetical protein HN51_028729 [Arachis hypogaea]
MLDFSVEYAENIGIHYYQTLRLWRKNFKKIQKHVINLIGTYFIRLTEILALGFDKKFIRTWEYYFDYCAASFKSRILGDYQVRIIFHS